MTKRKKKNPDAVRLGRRGGLKSGPARLAKLSPELRSAIASHASKVRWHGPEYAETK